MRKMLLGGVEQGAGRYILQTRTSWCWVAVGAVTTDGQPGPGVNRGGDNLRQDDPPHHRGDSLFILDNPGSGRSL